MRRLDEPGLRLLIGANVSIMGGKGKLIDCPVEVSKLVLKNLSMCEGLRWLKGRTDMPYAMPDGTVVVMPGYNPRTRYYYHGRPEGGPVVRECPTDDDVRTALSVLADAIRCYRFVDADSVAGALCGMLMSVFRRMMDRCPGLAITAPNYGAGKTFLAMTYGAVVEGRMPPVNAYAAKSGAAETRDWFISIAEEGKSVAIWDNLAGYINDSALASVLTTGRVGGRVKQFSRDVDAGITALIVITGANLTYSGELVRRFVRVVVDGGVDPTARRFDFYPMDRVLEIRQRVAAAACTMARWYFGAGATLLGGSDGGGYGDFDRLCRQPLLLAASRGLTSHLPWPAVGDPVAGLRTNAADVDPMTETQREVWMRLCALFDELERTTADVLEWLEAGRDMVSGRRGRNAVTDDVYGELRTAVLEMMNRDDVNRVTLGKALGARANQAVRLADGRWLKLIERKTGSVNRWRFEYVEAATDVAEEAFAESS